MIVRANKNESQMKPNESKQIKQRIEYKLSTETNSETNTDRIRIERLHIMNSNAFYLAVLHSRDSVFIQRKPQDRMLT